MRWAILTGEYAPQPGGVSDYSRLVARALAEAGDEVHVWVPPTAHPPGDGPAQEAGVCVRRLPDHFGPGGLGALEREFDRRRRPMRVLVQYVPHAFGCRAMNVPFCHWLYRLGRRDEVWTLFHEVAFPVARGQPLRHNVLGAVNRAMALLIARASRRVFVTIPAWGPMLRPLLPAGRRVEWLPVPSTVPTRVDAAAVAAVRGRLAPPAADGQGVLLGHFGTFGSHVAALLSAVLPPLLADGRRRAVLVGRGGPAFAAAVATRHPALADRLVATGGLAAADAAAHLAACDLVVQPYLDGVSGRRTSAMAGLALGTPVVTSRGPLTEPLWADGRSVALALDPTPAALVRAAERVLADPAHRRQLSLAGRDLYDRHFDIRHTIDVLRGVRPGVPVGLERGGCGHGGGHGA